MKTLSLIGLLTMSFAASTLVAGCSGGEVKAEDAKGYQEAGLKPGEKPIVATTTGTAGATGEERPER